MASKGVILTKHEKHGATYYVTSRLSKALAGFRLINIVAMREK